MASNGNIGDGHPATAPSEGFHHDVARDIGQQVEMMILEAKRQSEIKVGKEIGRLRQRMDAMHEKIQSVSERMGRLDTASQGLCREDFNKSIAKLEEVWDGEVGTLKQELWQTIQAHNHNADLLKHHKDVIDSIHQKVAEESEMQNPEVEQVHAQLMQVDKLLQREVAKEQQMDQLMQRLAFVQQQLSASAGQWAAAGSAFNPGLAAMSSLHASRATAGPQAAQLPGSGTAKKPQPKKATNGVAKTTKGAKATSAAGNNLTLRAEAPEFVPTIPTTGWSES